MSTKRSVKTTAKEKKSRSKEPIKKKQKADAPEEDGANGDVEWTEDLVNTMLTAITDDPQIKQGLFPSPGANVSTTKGGGKSKTEFHRQLATILFQDHPLYKDAFALAESKKQKAAWSGKVKNRLSKMSKIVAAFLAELGETGAGIRREDVDRERNPGLANKWDQIDQECPWFDDMRKLMGERPNAIPVGIGNSATDVDVSVVLPKLSGIHDAMKSEDEDDQSAYPIKNEDIDTPGSHDEDANSSSDDESTIVPSKRKSPVVDDKTPSRVSSKAAATPRPSGKKSKIAEFAEAAKAEEKTLQQREITEQQRQMTRQKQLAFATAKMERDKAKMEHKTERLRIKLELAKLKMNRDAAPPGTATSATSSRLPSMGLSSRESSIPNPAGQPENVQPLFYDGNFFGDVFAGGVNDGHGQNNQLFGEVDLGAGIEVQAAPGDGLHDVEGI